MSSSQDFVQKVRRRFGTEPFCAAAALCDDHPADSVAFTIVSPDLSSRDLTYGELTDLSTRVAGALSKLGVLPGDRVATLMGKGQDLVATLLGIWRLGAVHVPLFTAFAAPAIAARLFASEAKVVMCDGLQRPKLEPSVSIPAAAPWQIVLTGDRRAARDTDLVLAELIDAVDHAPPAVIGLPSDGLIRLFTSGTTGSPKGVQVPVNALAAFATYMHFGLDLNPRDVFWNAADPGWAYGLYFGIVGPMVMGSSNLLLDAGFNSDLTWEVLSRYRVTNFAAAPTVYRALRSGSPPTNSSGLALRACSSAGEPLNPDVVSWAETALGVPIRDQYGQTETGMTIVNGWHQDMLEPIEPGSMGHPLPGFAAAVLSDREDSLAQTGSVGRIAIDTDNSPLMWFDGYVDDPERTAGQFSPDRRWYYTGDVGTGDSHGRLYFSARDDDVILMAGYRIGPVDVESALIAHPAVVDAAVIGVPDEQRGEVVEAFVVLRSGFTGSDRLREDLKQHVKTSYAAHAYPRAINFVTALPRTPSGKLQRFLLRERREIKLPEQQDLRTTPSVDSYSQRH